MVDLISTFPYWKMVKTSMVIHSLISFLFAFDLFWFPFSCHCFSIGFGAPVMQDAEDDLVLEDAEDALDVNAPVLEDGEDAPVVEDVEDGLDQNVFDLNLPLDEFGAVDFDFVQNNLGK